MVKDLSVRDHVPSSDMKKPAQAIQVKPVEFLDMSAVTWSMSDRHTEELGEQQPCTL